MGQSNSILKACGVLDKSIVRISSAQPKQQLKFVCLDGNGILLPYIDDTATTYALVLADQGYLDYKFVTSDNEPEHLSIKQAKDPHTYTVCFSKVQKPGVHHLTLRLDKRVVLELDVYIELGPQEKATSEQANTQYSDPQPSFMADGPQFRTQVAQLETTLPQFRTLLKGIAERASKLAESLHQVSREHAHLEGSFKELQQLATQITGKPGSTAAPASPPPFLATVQSLGDLFHRQSSSYASQAKSAADLLFQPLQAYVSSALDSRMLSSRRKSYQEQAKLFYAYMGKNLSSSDSATLSKKIQFELNRFDYFSFLSDLVNGQPLRDLGLQWAKYHNVLHPDPLLLSVASAYASNYKVYNKRRAALRTRISQVQNYSDLSALIGDTATAAHKLFKEGILWTYKGQGKTSGWHKQWVVLTDSTLSEYSDWKKEGTKLARQPLNLTFACIKRSAQKPNGFDIITTDGTTRSFQAESENEVENWLRELQAAIGLHIADSAPAASPLQLVRSADESNAVCCDCGSTDHVEWISINLLCVVCIRCSGAHRSLGSHVSKIRSLTLDSFTSKESLELLQYVSNKNINSIYESGLTDKPITPTGSSDDERVAFIRAKYLEKRYVSPPLAEGVQEPASAAKKLSNSLLRAVHLNSIYLLQQCVAQGVVLADVRLENNETLFRYSLTHYHGTKDAPVFYITEFLILNGLQVDRLPPDTSSLSRGQLSYWKSKCDTLGVYKTRPVGRSATTAKKAPDVPRVNTASGLDTSTVHSSSSSSSSGPHANKRWSMGSIPASPLSVGSPSSLLTKPRNLKFPKLGGKN